MPYRFLPITDIMKITGIMNLTDILLPRSLTAIPLLQNLTVRPARWTDAPNTGGTLTTVMSTADTTINTVIATVPAKRLSARTGLTAGTTVDGIIGSKTTDDKKQSLRISQQLLFVC
ncbi:MAG: hypothetical protein HDR15_03555 [Lachnospiraceae bacterium]|nr:hypothetical protein [Lachnospiraceae bacterium]